MPEARERQGDDDTLVPLSRKTSPDLRFGTSRISNTLISFRESTSVPKNTRVSRRWSASFHTGGRSDRPSRGAAVQWGSSSCTTEPTAPAFRCAPSMSSRSCFASRSSASRGSDASASRRQMITVPGRRLVTGDLLTGEPQAGGNHLSASYRPFTRSNTRSNTTIDDGSK